MWNPFKRPPILDALPPDVADTIESASFLARSASDADGVRRVLISIPGWRFYADNIDENVRKIWPDLNTSQVRRATHWLQARTAAHLRAVQDTQAAPRWKDWRADCDEFGRLQA